MKTPYEGATVKLVGAILHVKAENPATDLTFDLGSSNNMDHLSIGASALAERTVEVTKTTDNQYVALYLRFETPPPPKADPTSQSYGETPEYAGELREAT